MIGQKKDNTWEGPGCLMTVVGVLVVVIGLCLGV